MAKDMKDHEAGKGSPVDSSPKKIYTVQPGHNLNHHAHKEGEDVSLSNEAAKVLLEMGVVKPKEVKK